MNSTQIALQSRQCVILYILYPPYQCLSLLQTNARYSNTVKHGTNMAKIDCKMENICKGGDNASFQMSAVLQFLCFGEFFITFKYTVSTSACPD